jgi:hypothetical protein
MTRKSSHTVTYKSLVDLAVEVLSERQERYAGARARGTTNLEPLTEKVEAAETLVRMLKKGLPAKQTDFVELFEQVKK